MTDSERPVRDAYDRLAPGYDRRWLRYVERSVAETLDRTPLPAHGRILDVGCGTGALLDALARPDGGPSLTGVDLSPGMLQVARARVPPSVGLAAATARSLPFGSGLFDVVFSTSALHVWAAPSEGLGEIRRVLHPGGVLVLTDWCRDFWTIRWLDRALRLVDPAHEGAHAAPELRRMLERAGFRVRRLERYRIDWLWGLMTARAEIPAD